MVASFVLCCCLLFVPFIKTFKGYLMGWCNQGKNSSYFEKKAELENVTLSVAVSETKKVDVTNNRRMAGDTWSKSRSERLLRQQLTHTHRPPSHCRTLDTNTHSCQGQTKIIHKTPNPNPPLPWVSLTPFLPHAHTPSNHTCTHKVAGRQHAVHVACGESLLSSAD